MLRMEVALFLILAFLAISYFPSERKSTPLQSTYSVLLVVMLVHMAFDGATVYTVNHLDTVPGWINDWCHRIFIGSMVLVFYLFYKYMSILVSEETGKPRRFRRVAKIYLIFGLLAELILPLHYAETPLGNYSDGIHVNACYFSVFVYLILGLGTLITNWNKVERKKKIAISFALAVELCGSLIQSQNPTWLLSGMGLTLMTLAFYLILENPEALKAELTEAKMSALYLKSQVNPHFLYNTLDTIRIQAQLNGDKKVADLLMNLVDFFRLSVKVNKPIVAMDNELELLEAYMELMCYRYPDLHCEYDIEPDLESAQVPNFILQPIVENSLLHGLKNKGYRGMVKISAHQISDQEFEVSVYDTGSGFPEGKKAVIDEMLRTYKKQNPKLTENSIGVLNVHKRIKLLCGPEYGLSYTENPEGGVTAHLRLPLKVATAEASR